MGDISEAAGSTPAPAPVPADSARAAETALAMALHSMAHAAGLAMLAGPHAQACSRQVGAAAVAMVCKGLLDADFKSRPSTSPHPSTSQG